jgi:hypothetical protein
MLTTMGPPIRHACNILALLDAALFPKEVLVIHRRGHQKGDNRIAKGNKMADKAAKWAAMQEYTAGWRGYSPCLRETTISIRGK